MSTATPIPDVSKLLTSALSNPQTAIVMIIQFLLGLALGYVAVKAFKYIIAMLIIIVIGTFLSIWSLGGTLTQVFETLKPMFELAKNFAIVLGIFTVAPITLGFVIGVIIALFRK